MRIEAKNLVKIYGDRCVVNDNSFYINKGEVVCLLGPNGAGKTTTFYMIVGLVKPNSGQVFIDDKEITNWPMNLRAKAGIGYLIMYGTQVFKMDLVMMGIVTLAILSFCMYGLFCLIEKKLLKRRG